MVVVAAPRQSLRCRSCCKNEGIQGRHCIQFPTVIVRLDNLQGLQRVGVSRVTRDECTLRICCIILITKACSRLKLRYFCVTVCKSWLGVRQNWLTAKMGLLTVRSLALAGVVAQGISQRTKRFLPAGSLNMGYVGGDCNETVIINATQSGLNVLFWFAINLIADPSSGEPAVSGGPDLDCVARVAGQLAALNLPTTHMITVGGWDAPHPDTTYPPAAMYAAWKRWNEQTVARPGLPFGFDGIDWDMEGYDDPANPNNNFTVECLDLVGQFSQMAQSDGYIVSLVPPESYLDPTTPLYDRSLLHAYPEWQPNFLYHGHNAYALLLVKYGNTSLGPGSAAVPTFDLVSIQLYESWSHADYNITAAPGSSRQTGAQYLAAWVPRVLAGWWVDFGSDPASGVPSQMVSVLPSQLVIGLANAWAGNPKSLLIMPDQVGQAWTTLKAQGQLPRGTVFWTILNEGDVPYNQSEPLWYAAGINSFMHTRG